MEVFLLIVAAGCLLVNIILITQVFDIIADIDLRLSNIIIKTSRLENHQHTIADKTTSKPIIKEDKE